MINIKLDHIGIAVPSLENDQFYTTLGLKRGHSEIVESEKVKVGMYELQNDCRIELLQPTSNESPIAKFIEKRGPGIHHICLQVQGIDQLLKVLKAAGVKLINETAKDGAHGCRIAFIHPQATGGVLIELSEPKG